MTGTGAQVTYDVPGSAWLLGWASLVGQLALLVERGPTEADSALLSAPLSALVVAWVSHGVLRARMVRTWLAGILLLLMALFGVLALVEGTSPAAVVGAVAGVVAFGALLDYAHSDCFARLRQEPQRSNPSFGGLVVLALTVGALGGLTATPVAGEQQSGFHVRIGL